MDKEGMLSLGASAFVGVKSKRLDIITFIKCKKAIESGIYDPDYDYNRDGVLDNKDAFMLQKYLLGVISSEELTGNANNE